ncbi:MAG TPA: PHB depolymerase family esterase [Burkholderiales bacterium]|nr:PHB depolymerase family esterase [Burkholderiales bacterium]
MTAGIRLVLLLALAAPLAARAAEPLAAGDHELTLEHGGLERSYLAHLPPQAGRPLPVVINLHGGGGNATAHQKYTRMDALADREGFIVLYPNGTGRFGRILLTWNAGTCCGSAALEGVDDVGFIAAMLDDLAARTPVDAKRVYATGLSNGAMMAYRLAAELPQRIAAIAPVAGSMVLPGPIAHPVPVLDIHSVDDPRALYAGGLGPPFPMTTTRVFHPPVAETLARWAAANHCTEGEPRVAETRQGSGESAGHTATLLVWQGCAAPLEHWKLTGAGHVWPGGKLKYLTHLLGPGTDVIDANAEMWKFFSRFRLGAR